MFTQQTWKTNNGEWELDMTRNNRFLAQYSNQLCLLDSVKELCLVE